MWRLVVASVIAGMPLGALLGGLAANSVCETKLEDLKHREKWDTEAPASKAFQTCDPESIKCDGFRSTELSQKPGSPGKLLIHCSCEERGPR